MVNAIVKDGGKEFVGTMSALWGITAGVFLALMGPQGIQELGRLIVQKSQYAMKRISEIGGIDVILFQSSHFKEFIVDFNGFGKSVNEVNQLLLEKGIFGGQDLSKDFSELGESALYCVTEVHTKEDIDRLVQALTEAKNK